MAKVKVDPILCTRVLSDLEKEGIVKSAYLLYGEERYLLLQNKRQLFNYLGVEDDDMNVNFYDDSNVNVEEILSQAVTVPFFADRRVIVIEDAGLFSSEGERVAEFLKNCPETTVFVFIEQKKPDKRGALFKAIKSVGVEVEYLHQTEATLAKWVASRVRKEGKSISPSVISFFLSRTGNDLSHVEQELLKLVFYVGDEATITVDDIKAVTGAEVEDQIFAMIEAISRKDRKKALALYRDLVLLKTAPIVILSLITSEFEKMLLVKSLLGQGRRPQEIAALTGINEFFIKNRIAIISQYSYEELKRCFDLSVETDASFKSGHIADRVAVEVLLMELTES